MSTTDDEESERCGKLVGTTLRGTWMLDALLGIGGMAAVYAATHATGRRDAIKILHPHVAFSKELRARFEQEARAISTLGHPGTVKVLDFDQTDQGAPFMVMELLEGESLGQRAFRTGGIGEMDLLGYMERVLEVLVAAHDIGIVHRDIKPDNLFIANDGRVKVLDFGIARMKEGGSGAVHTRTGAMLGTTSYMAPEQIHARTIDGRTDVYAVGATMFRVLAKRRVHEAETDAEMLIKMGSTPAPSLSSIAPAVDARVAAIVDRALVFDRDARYPDARAMLHDARAVLRGEDPPFAAAALRPTVVRARPPGVHGPSGRSQAMVPPASHRSIALDPTLYDVAAPVLGPTDSRPVGVAAAASGQLPPRAIAAAAATWSSGAPTARRGGDRRRSLGLIVGVGAVVVAVAGLIAAVVIVANQSSRAGSSSPDEAGRGPDEDARNGRGSARTSRGPKASRPKSHPPELLDERLHELSKKAGKER